MKKELIERFFNKQCTAEEARQVAAFLKADPEALEEYLTVQEWNGIEANKKMTHAFWDKIWEDIKPGKPASLTAGPLKKYAVAASIATLACIAYYYYPLHSNKKGGNTVLSDVAVNEKKAPVSKQQAIINTLKKPMTIILPDSSTAELAPGTAINYDPSFQNKRDIRLSGEALFTVTKNKSKPFTVYTASLTTTALGTVFKVTTGKRSPGDIRVRLFTGKVVIRSIDKNLKGWTKDVYLSPGEQMQYDAGKMFVNVNRINKSDPGKRPHAMLAVKQDPPAPDSVLNFDGTPLPDVITKLSGYFSVKIEFSRAEIEKMNFTGAINKNDSLNNVLKLIGRMNDLEIVQKEDRLVLQKISK